MNAIQNLKEIAKHTTPISALMAFVSVTLIAYTTNLIFMFSTYPHSAGVIIMLGFASIAVAIIVALDLVDNYECKQTQESNGK